MDIIRDSAGQIWDEGLHNSNKEQKADGTWKKRPGNSREAELRDKSVRQASERVPAGVARMKQTVSLLPKGYRPYWASVSMFEELENAGYHFVKKDHALVGSDETTGSGLGNIISMIANPSSGERHYLMAIKEEWWKENQAIKEKPLDQFEEALNSTADNFYVPNKNSITREQL